ncbi:HugZ family protein [Aureimonas jatrophae]|uniref:Uncharacterized protein n=1 Tax=Aureimonas jatrophae TaxID=1166073 RepID=A0A1H0ELC2_9HYPH|nr:DUF2470 domain-containing protein [Aureimonas jatrophae]MBB3950443.1 hypothetical protein [Aureimonas jatrophae]SDN83143.1 hypothetical protein SAMN05192530_10293 [Aureimonas jatrophae]
MTEPAVRDPYLAPDETARRQARQLARSAGHGALSCLEPETGDPLVSRVALGHLPGGQPLLLVSDLSPHTRALAVDGRCALMVGELGAGDPLSHPRLMIKARAHALSRDAPDAALARARFLARHPKAELYVDFPDFRFLRLDIVSALFNAGFARAYRMTPGDVSETVPDDLQGVEARVRTHMNDDHAEAIDAILKQHGAEGSGWRIATIDPLGFEAVNGERARRVEFRRRVDASSDYRLAFVELVRASEG